MLQLNFGSTCLFDGRTPRAAAQSAQVSYFQRATATSGISATVILPAAPRRFKFKNWPPFARRWVGLIVEQFLAAMVGLDGQRGAVVEGLDVFVHPIVYRAGVAAEIKDPRPFVSQD